MPQNPAQNRKRQQQPQQNPQKAAQQNQNVQERVQRRNAHPGLTKWQLNGEDLLMEVEAKLKGQQLQRDNNGNVVDTEQVGTQLMSDQRIDEVLDLCGMYLNKNVQLSEFTESEIHRIMRDLKKDLVDYFEIAYIEGDIEKNQLDIAMHIGNFIWGALARAKYGGERKFIGETESRTVSLNPADERNDSRFGWLPGF